MREGWKGDKEGQGERQRMLMDLKEGLEQDN